MARSLRIEFEGAVYHVMSRGNERRVTPLPGREIAQAPGYRSPGSLARATRRVEAAR